MLYIALLIGLFWTCCPAAGQFDPGCSFSDGQCLYNIKLGHEGQCDSITTRANSQTTDANSNTAFQTCSCKDVETVTSNVHTLSLNMQTLQSNFEKLAQALNVTQESLVTKDAELAALLAEKQNLTAQNVEYEILLNKSQIDLANTVAALKAELERVRAELATTSNQLVTCQTVGNTAAPTSITPALYGDYNVHYCGFEDGKLCGYTLQSCTSSSVECWHLGSGRQDVYSGPVEDHTYGAPNGHYIYIDPENKPAYHSSSSSASVDRIARITTQEFPPAPEYCVKFWYTMYGSDIRQLKVYAQVGGGNGYPIYSMSGQVDAEWHMAQITVDSEYSSNPFNLVFEGTTDSYYTYSSSSTRPTHNTKGFIAIDDVFVYNTSCSALPTCPAGSRQRKEGNVTSCYSYHVTPLPWYDAVDVCKSEAPNGHLVSVNSLQEQIFVTDVINSDASLTAAGDKGWYSSGNDERTEGGYKWTDTGLPYSLNYTNWHEGQPNNVGNNQNCLLLEYKSSDYEWGDVNCQDAHPFICEIQYDSTM